MAKTPLRDLIHAVSKYNASFFKFCSIFLVELNSKGLYLSLKKELEIVVLCSRRHQNVKYVFYVVVL